MPRSLKSPEIPLETFSKVVEAIYDCALDPNRWQSTIPLIAELLESQRCVLGVHDYVSGCNELTFQMGYEDEHYWRLHEERYSRLSPLFAPMQMMPVGAVATRAMLVDDREFEESKYYTDWVKPQGLRDATVVKTLQTAQRIGLLVVNRLDTYPRYGQAEVRLLTLLSPHVCRAVTISDALNLKTIRSDALEATLNALTSGVYLADSLGRIIYMNQAAERQIKNGNVLRIENNRLAPIDRVARAALTGVIDEAMAEEAATPDTGFSLALPSREGAGLVATILPLSRGERQNLCGAFAAMAAIFVQDPVVVPPFPGEAFAKLYSLTGSELRVLLAMAPGLGVKEAAEMLGVGETTAKTHLQHIYAKTGTSKQTELMHLFMSSAPPVQAA
jgi:DNA-binding CsgD family transcriptional regulator/PAS domain-containing protein